MLPCQNGSDNKFAQPGSFFGNAGEFVTVEDRPMCHFLLAI